MRFFTQEILTFAVQADDGVCGSVRDVLFDDTTWGIRYLVMRRSDSGRTADFQLPIDRIRLIDPVGRVVHFCGSKDDAQSTDLVDIDPPVSRQEQIKRSAIWALAPIYEFDFTWGTFPVQPNLFTRPAKRAEKANRTPDILESTYDPHLRSSREVIGYRVQSPNGKAGRIADIVFESANNLTRCFVIETRRLWRRTRLLLPVESVHGICWSLRRVSTNLDKHAVRSLSHYMPA